MAYADYYHCDVCDSKAFYDANVDWEVFEGIDMRVLCEKCAKDYEVIIKKKENTPC